VSEDLAHIFQKFIDFIKEYPQLSNEDICAFGAFLGQAVGEAYAVGLIKGKENLTKASDNESN